MIPTAILDNGHGIETPGKRSPVWPDGKQLLEYEFNRDVVRRIYEALHAQNIPFRVLVPELKDISLSERVRRANEIYQAANRAAFLISVHANAGGGTGWEVWTSKGLTKSDAMATVLFEEAQREFPDWRMRSDYSDGDPDKEAQFTILARTQCPAVLTENFFMDTEKDCRFIMSNEGRQRVAKMHVCAIERIIRL